MAAFAFRLEAAAQLSVRPSSGVRGVEEDDEVVDPFVLAEDLVEENDSEASLFWLRIKIGIGEDGACGEEGSSFIFFLPAVERYELPPFPGTSTCSSATVLRYLVETTGLAMFIALFKTCRSRDTSATDSFPGERSDPSCARRSSCSASAKTRGQSEENPLPMTDDSIYNIEYSVVNVVVNVNVNNVVFSFSEYRRGGRRRECGGPFFCLPNDSSIAGSCADCSFYLLYTN